MIPSRIIRAASGIAALALFATITPAQSLMQSHGRVLAAQGNAVPGVPGAVFGGTGAFDFPVLDESGSVLFRARMTGGGATALDDRAYYYGRTAADLALILRGNDPVPGNPLLSLSTATASGLGANPRLSPDGQIFFSTAVSGPSVVTTNDSCMFIGSPAGFGLVVREGDPAPGTIGATFSSSFSNLSYQPTGVNEQFRVLFQSGTAGGDTVTSNNAAWFTGPPGGLEIVIRKGDAVLNGAVVSALGFISQMNTLGQIVHEESLSTTLGTTPATTANDRVLFIYTPGSGNVAVVREGDPAPGTSGAIFANASNSWSFGTGSNSFNVQGEVALNLELFGGDVVAGANDRAVYIGTTSGVTMFMRRGDPAPGTGGAFFGVANNSSLGLNGPGSAAFQATITGPSVTAADDTGIWTGTAGNLKLVVREGAPAPNTVGAVFGNLSGLAMQTNNRGQILFHTDLVGGDAVPGVNASAIYVYEPSIGLMQVIRQGDSIEVSPGVFRTVSTYGGSQFSNGNGCALGFNARGDVAQKVNMTDGTNAMMVVNTLPFSADVSVISAAVGGVQTLHLNGGLGVAGGTFVVAGSATGTFPGIPVDSFTIPLVPDFYFTISLDFANIPPFGNTFGVLDAQGRTISTLTAPPGVPGLAGVTLYHAFAALNGSTLAFASDAIPVTFIP